MDNWTIAFSPGGFTCQAVWGDDKPCGRTVGAGYMIGKHPDWPHEWMCLNCMIATVRQHLRENQIALLNSQTGQPS